MRCFLIIFFSKAFKYSYFVEMRLLLFRSRFVKSNRIAKRYLTFLLVEICKASDRNKIVYCMFEAPSDDAQLPVAPIPHGLEQAVGLVQDPPKA